MVFWTTFICCIVTCLSLSEAHASVSVKHVFYVDAQLGDDAHSGQSPATAWKTTSAANEHRFRAGDHLYFHADQEFAGMLRPTGSGTPQAPIVVSSYGSGDPARLVGDGGLATILLADVSFWTICNIQVTNDGHEEAKRSGILVEATQSGEVVKGITIEHVHVYNVRGLTGEDNSAKDTGGIGIFASALDRPARFDGIMVKASTIEHVDNVGLWLNSYPLLNPEDPRWTAARNEHIVITGNRISDTGRNAIIVRQAVYPIIEGNTVSHASARHHGNAIFTRSTRDAVIRGNEVSFTGTEPSGENAAFDADIGSLRTVIEYNWSHDNQGGLFSLCNNPYDETNVTDGTIVRFNVSENDGIRAFGFSGAVTHSLIYNNTVFIGPGHKEAIVEMRPFSESRPRFADGAVFFNNLLIVAGEAFYDLAEAKDLSFDSNCIIGSVQTELFERRAVAIMSDTWSSRAPAKSWGGLKVYRDSAQACGSSSHRDPEDADRDLDGAILGATPFHGALNPAFRKR